MWQNLWVTRGYTLRYPLQVQQWAVPWDRNSWPRAPFWWQCRAAFRHLPQGRVCAASYSSFADSTWILLCTRWLSIRTFCGTKPEGEVRVGNTPDTVVQNVNRPVNVWTVCMPQPLYFVPEPEGLALLFQRLPEDAVVVHNVLLCLCSNAGLCHLPRRLGKQRNCGQKSAWRVPVGKRETASVGFWGPTGRRWSPVTTLMPGLAATQALGLFRGRAQRARQVWFPTWTSRMLFECCAVCCHATVCRYWLINDERTSPRGLWLAYPLRCRGYWIEYQ